MRIYKVNNKTQRGIKCFSFLEITANFVKSAENSGGLRVNRLLLQSIPWLQWSVPDLNSWRRSRTRISTQFTWNQNKCLFFSSSYFKVHLKSFPTTIPNKNSSKCFYHDTFFLIFFQIYAIRLFIPVHYLDMNCVAFARLHSYPL